MKKIAEIDKRSTPRFKTENVRISGGLSGRVLNLHDGGATIQSSDVLNLQEKFILNLEFPSKVFSASAVLRWKHAENGHFVYGAEFDPLNPQDSVGLWRFLISERYKKICKNIADRQTRVAVLRFAKKLTRYIAAIIETQNMLTSGKKKSSRDEVLSAFSKLNNDIVLAGENLKNVINSKNIFDQIKKDFRDIVGCWAFKSQIMKRGFDKPKGYPGDYETLEVIYDRETFGDEGSLGYLFDLYFLTNPYADAVRQRMEDLREKVERIFLKATTESTTKILDLASGSAREFYEIFKDKKNQFMGDHQITLLDWDSDSLEFTRKRHLQVQPSNFKFTYLKEDLLNFIKNDYFFQENGAHDFIYSIGLADYLPDRVLKKMIKICAAGLKTKGQFVLAHKDKKVSFSHLPPEWFCDWVFIPRDTNELMSLYDSCGLGENFEWKLEQSKSLDIFYIILQKNA